MNLGVRAAEGFLPLPQRASCCIAHLDAPPSSRSLVANLFVTTAPPSTSPWRSVGACVGALVLERWAAQQKAGHWETPAALRYRRPGCGRVAHDRRRASRVGPRDATARLAQFLIRHERRAAPARSRPFSVGDRCWSHSLRRVPGVAVDRPVPPELGQLIPERAPFATRAPPSNIRSDRTLFA